MQSRVRTPAGHRSAVPAGLGRVAASTLADQHEPSAAPGLGGQLQATPGGQGQRFLRLSDDQTDRGRAQGLLATPEQVGLIGGAQQM